MLIRQKGFTLVELVAIIVLLGILSVTVVSNYSSKGTFAERTVRDRMVAIARYAQQRAMYDQNINTCYRFHIDAVPLPPAVQEYGAQRSIDAGVTWNYFGPANTDSEHPNNINDGRIAMANDVTINDQPTNNLPINIFFDGLGNAFDSCDPATRNPIAPTITINGEFPQTVTISGAGYVQ
jgi:type II secretory pathway pseudopilin PulG